MIYVLFAILCGVTNVLSRSVNFVLSDKIGMYQSTFFNYIFGLVGSVLILLISGETFKLFSSSTYTAPWYIYAGGLIGILTVLFTNIGFMGLGVSLTVSLSLLGQLVTSLVIDHFGYFNMTVVEFDKKKILGLIIIIAGIYVMTLS